jgi:hypothetical protein
MDAKFDDQILHQTRRNDAQCVAPEKRTDMYI